MVSSSGCQPTTHMEQNTVSHTSLDQGPDQSKAPQSQDPGGHTGHRVSPSLRLLCKHKTASVIAFSQKGRERNLEENIFYSKEMELLKEQFNIINSNEDYWIR